MAIKLIISSYISPIVFLFIAFISIITVVPVEYVFALEETINIQLAHPLKDEGIYRYEEDKESLFVIYRKQVINLYEKGIISFDAANLALCNIRKELGLPFLGIYPVHNQLDNITL